MKSSMAVLALALCMLLHANARDLLEACFPQNGQACSNTVPCCPGGLWCSEAAYPATRLCRSSGDPTEYGVQGNDCILSGLLPAGPCECNQETGNFEQLYAKQIIAWDDGSSGGRFVCPTAAELEATYDADDNPHGSKIKTCEIENETCPPEQNPECPPTRICNHLNTANDLKDLCDKNDGSVIDWWCNPGGQCAACPVGQTRKDSTVEEVALEKKKNCCNPQGLKMVCPYCDGVECGGED